MKKYAWLIMLTLSMIMVGCSREVPEEDSEVFDTLVSSGASDVKTTEPPTDLQEESVPMITIEPWKNECFKVDDFYFEFGSYECKFPTIVDDFFVHSIMWELPDEELITSIVPEQEYELKTAIGESDMLCTVAHHNEEMVPYRDSNVISVDCSLIEGNTFEIFGMEVTSSTSYEEIKDYFGKPDINEKSPEVRAVGYRTNTCLITFLFGSDDLCYYVMLDDEMFWPSRE